MLRPMATISLMLLLIIIMAQSAKTGSGAGSGSGSVVEVVEEGAEERGEYRPAVMEQQVMRIGRRNLLAPFQVCLVCKCCVNATTCVNMPCCFGIDCQLPNKPFGFCAFVPKMCNCATCAA